MDTNEALKVLGLTPNASASDIKQAYRDLMQQYHPDKVAHLGPEFRVLAEKKAKEINEAFQVLSDYQPQRPPPPKQPPPPPPPPRESAPQPPPSPKQAAAATPGWLKRNPIAVVGIGCLIIAAIVLAKSYSASKELSLPPTAEPAALEIERRAKSGDPSAQVDLGLLYEYGNSFGDSGFVKIDSTLRNAAEAVKWYRKLADNGDARGNYLLAEAYRKGLGVKKDSAEALVWHRKATDTVDGYPYYQYTLGSFYYSGTGAPKDYAEAARWFRRAANQNYADAQFTLGLIYERGEGVPKDYAEAASWYLKAAELGMIGAQNNLGVLYHNGTGVPRDYATAFKWYTKAAQRGELFAQRNLGGLYQAGLGTVKDYVKAYMWYNIAAAATWDGSADAAKQRDALALQMSAKDISIAQRLSSEWKPQGRYASLLAHPPNVGTSATQPREQAEKLAKPVNRFTGLHADDPIVEELEKLPEVVPPTGLLRLYHGKAVAPLEIVTKDRNVHYYAKVVDAKSGSLVATIFIRGGETAKLEVPLGIFRIRYAVGGIWRGEKALFGPPPSTQCIEAKEDFQFRVEGDRVLGHTIELFLQRDGNLKTEEIPLESF